MLKVIPSVFNCQGEFWKYNSHTEKWEGSPVFKNQYRIYYESLKNCNKRTSASVQALPMLPKDLAVIMQYLDSLAAKKHFTQTEILYLKAFMTTAFTLWTR